MIEILNVTNIKIPSINNKFNYNPKIGRLFLSKPYREFKKFIELSIKKVKVEAPYRIDIYLEMYLDLDNPLKAILDGLESIIENDKLIQELRVYKTPLKRGQPGSIKILIGTIND